MENYDYLIIGFGKAGKTLAAKLAQRGSVALVERSKKMYGGTCINVACIPSKSLEHSARMSNLAGGDFSAREARYRAAIEEKRRLTAALREKNYAKLASSGVKVIDGEASFVGSHELEVRLATGETARLFGKQIFINTGSRPFVPPVPGLSSSPFVYTSETLMELDKLPRELVIIGGGYIGLEFASYYANFGSRVTLVQDGEEFIPREDDEIARCVLENLNQRGVSIVRSARVESVGESGGRAAVHLEVSGAKKELAADAVLVATGRRPNIEALHPERAGIKLTERGAIAVDKTLRTSVPDIWAMGDVTGGLQFTYISLDDSRIVLSQLLGDGSRTTENRGEVPYSVFIDPPLSRVGMTERQARESGREVKIARLPAAAIPKAQVLRQPTGLLKAVVDAGTGEILGVHLFCAESQEMINIIKLAMDAKLPYTALRDAIYNHPTMSEALNDLFAAL